MKLSNFIRGLQIVKKEHGDLDVIYSSDDEGNSYGQIYFSPTPVFVKEMGDHMTDDGFVYRGRRLKGKEKFNAIIIN